MNFFKKILTATLLVVSLGGMAAGLAACGDKENTTPPKTYDLYERSHFAWDETDTNTIVGLSEEGEEIARGKSTVSISIPEGTIAISKPGTKLANAPFCYYDSIPAESPIMTGSSEEGWWSKVDDIKFPSSLIALNDYALYNCQLITKLELPENLQVLGESALSEVNMEEITLPASLTTLGSSQFYGCECLKRVKFEQGYNVDYLPSYIFGYCDGLEEFTVPSCVKTIQNLAFYDCESLSSLTLNEGLITIGQQALVGTALTSITLPSTVTGLRGYTVDYGDHVDFEPNSGDSPFCTKTWHSDSSTYTYSNTFDEIVCANKEQYDLFMAGSDTVNLPECDKEDLTYPGKAD